MPKEYKFINKRITKGLGTNILSTPKEKKKDKPKDDRFPEGDIAPAGWHRTQVRHV